MKRTLLTVLLLSPLAANAQNPAPAADTFAAASRAGESGDKDPVMIAYRDALIAQLDNLDKSLPEITRSADIAADRLVAGGNLYVGGDNGFVSESFIRSGGMMMAQVCKDTSPISAGDVLLVGSLANDEQAVLKLCQRAKDAGAYVVLISPAFGAGAALEKLCDMHVVNFAGPDPVVPVGGGKRAGPASALYNVTALWAYTAELVGACTRRGRIPKMWQSVVVPGGRERNKRYHPVESGFHNDMAIPPQPEGTLGRSYIDAIRREATGLRGPVMEQLARAAADMADCVRGGGKTYVRTVSHFTSHVVTGPGVPAWISADYDFLHTQKLTADQLAQSMKKGDVFFLLGYYSEGLGLEVDQSFIPAIRNIGGKSVVALCHSPFAPLEGPQPDMLIDSQWEYGDATVLLPGYDIRIFPSSGVLQTAIFWSVVAKAESLLSAQNE